MLMHTCWSIIYFWLSGFCSKVKRVQIDFEKGLKTSSNKRKMNSFLHSIPFLSFGPSSPTAGLFFLSGPQSPTGRVA
jgi:hypothetical protein